MKFVILVAGAALIAWTLHVPAPPSAATRPVDATVTRDGHVVSVTIESPRGLRFHAQRESGEVRHDLDLSSLPPESRVVSAQLGAFGEHGLAVALAIASDAGTEYRWLFTPGDPLAGELLAPGHLANTGPERSSGWTLSGPLFTSSGEPYRLVDIHNPGGDSLELTFRRGELQGVREGAGSLSLDERIVHDTCPPAERLAIAGSSVGAVVDRIVAAP
jgi:hypothetical protein